MAHTTLVRHVVGERGIERQVEGRRDSPFYQRAIHFPILGLLFGRLLQLLSCVVDYFIRTLLSREAVECMPISVLTAIVAPERG